MSHYNYINWTDDEKLAVLLEHPGRIKHMYNPSEVLQMAAVTQDWHLIQHIDYPTEAAQIACLSSARSRTLDALRMIKHPSESVKVFAALCQE